MQIRLAPKYFVASAALMGLMFTTACGLSAKDSLKTEKEKTAFLDSCTSEASGGGNVATDKIKTYCQCSYDNFISDRVSDEDLDTFLAEDSNSDKWPKVITDILTECAEKALA